jgi:hypothetical protein
MICPSFYLVQRALLNRIRNLCYLAQDLARLIGHDIAT